MYNFIEKILTASSKYKLDKLSNNIYPEEPLHPNLINLLSNMIDASTQKIILKKLKPMDELSIKEVIKSFDQEMNHVIGSKLENDLNNMHETLSVVVESKGNKITVNFIMKNISKLVGTVSAILHAIHVFTYLFSGKYDGLSIFICLSENKRSLDFRKVRSMFLEKKKIAALEYLRKNSGALTISGLTRKSKNVIILTKIEEILKLLFHELVHYVGLDANLDYVSGNQIGLNVQDEIFNVSEAYSEFMSILLYSGYQAIHMASINGSNPLPLYSYLLNLESNYSLYLAANILKLYGYKENTSFFSGGIQNFLFPIPIIEYVFLRAQMLMHINDIADLVGTNWYVELDKVNKLLSFTKMDFQIISRISTMMEKTIPTNNLSYAAIELNLELL